MYSLKKRIHINQHQIRANKKNGTDLPAITVKTYKSNTYAKRVTIHGSSTVVQSEKPLPCGARCWVETEAEVTIE